METETQETPISLHLSLPLATKAFIEQEVVEGGYDTLSEYVRELLEEAQRRKAEARLETSLLKATDNGPTQPMAKEDWDEIKQRGLARLSHPPLYETATPAELAQAFLDWAESHDRSIPPLPLSAVSRESIYEDR